MAVVLYTWHHHLQVCNLTYRQLLVSSNQTLKAGRQERPHWWRVQHSMSDWQKDNSAASSFLPSEQLMVQRACPSGGDKHRGPSTPPDVLSSLYCQEEQSTHTGRAGMMIRASKPPTNRPSIAASLKKKKSVISRPTCHFPSNLGHRGAGESYTSGII